MAVKTTKIDKVVSLQIGQNFENLGTTIYFDMADWMTLFPDASLFVLFKRPSDQHPAPVACTYDAEKKILAWQVSSWETSEVGVGRMEVRAVDADTGLLKKSKVVPCSVEETIDPEETTPDPYERWLDSLLAAADRAEGAAAAAAAISGGMLHFDMVDGRLYLNYTNDVPYRFALEDGRLVLYGSDTDE